MNWDWNELEQKKNKNTRQETKTPWNPSPPDFSSVQRFAFPFVSLLLLIVVLIWIATGFYIVQPDEVGVVTRFGTYTETTTAGPHFHWPYPIGNVYKPKVTEVKRIEIGRSSSDSDDIEMLTQDENLINVQFSVQYQISDPVQYVFKVAQHDALIRDASLAVMREVIADNLIDAALTDGKLAIQMKAQELLQDLVQRYNLGINILSVQLQNVFPPQPVSDAFKAVASAREDKIRYINEAEAYRNSVLPKARGEAAAILNEAEAYKTSKLLIAKANITEFSLLLNEYKKSPQITKQRLYIEALEQVLNNDSISKFILPEGISKGVLPYLPLSQKGNK